jgi:hypothetical protein
MGVMSNGTAEKDNFSRYFMAKLKVISKRAPAIARKSWFPKFQAPVLVSKPDANDLLSSSSDDSEGHVGDECSKPVLVSKQDANDFFSSFSNDSGGLIGNECSTHFTSQIVAATAMMSHVGSGSMQKQLMKSLASVASEKSGLASSPTRAPRKKRKEPSHAREATDISTILFKYPMERETPQWVTITEADRKAVADPTAFLSTSVVDFQLLHNVSKCPLVLQHTFDALFFREVSDEQITLVKMSHSYLSADKKANGNDKC